MAARELDLEHFHQRTTLLHLDIESLNVSHELIKVSINLCRRNVGYIFEVWLFLRNPMLLLLLSLGDRPS